MCIYTDGSEINGEVVAAAYSLKDRKYETRALRSNKNTNVYAGELVGVHACPKHSLPKNTRGRLQHKTAQRRLPYSQTVKRD